MRNSLNPRRGAAHNGWPGHPGNGPGMACPPPRSSPGAASLKEGRPSFCALLEQGREDNGSRRDLSPWSLLPKMLERPSLQLQGLGRNERGRLPLRGFLHGLPPLCPSAPNHPDELSRKISGLELERGVGMGRKGLESSFDLQHLSCIPLSPHPFLSVRGRFYGLVF